MANTKAKDRKRLKHKLNANLKKYGRTKRQNKVTMMKSALMNYNVEFVGTIDERYKQMHEHIARTNRLVREKAEAAARAAKEKENATNATS